ncbi:uncharacterized protein LOC128559155 [Mercenaria mercenaria]|uniref:uncharacterized protein LOC128559155 n=1 Tax=Mercenaria mercenaria TaxID=6596 RepID=UPI00234E74CC|nr:uncharacterized protein LOC128559155 [Mercenaria mercenaria]
MKLLYVLVVMVVAMVIMSSLEAAGRNSRERKNKNKRKNKKKNLKGPKHWKREDPTDLNNLLPRCSDGGGTGIPTFFSGMFLSPREIDTLVKDTKEEMKPSTARRSKTRYVQRNRLSKRIGTISTFAAPSNPKDQSCCETELKVTAPGQVMVDGKSMSVVHMNHSYQYVQEGECVTPGSSCRGIGICTQSYKYSFMLLYDPDLVGKVNPPVRYGRVPVKSHCECMNIGRVIK